MGIWEMTLEKALGHLKEQKFVGEPTAIFNKLLIFKVGAGTVGPAYKGGVIGGMLGGSSNTHRERSLNTAHHTVVKNAHLAATDKQKTWTDLDGQRLWNIGPKTGFLILWDLLI